MDITCFLLLCIVQILSAFGKRRARGYIQDISHTDSDARSNAVADTTSVFSYGKPGHNFISNPFRALAANLLATAAIPRMPRPRLRAKPRLRATVENSDMRNSGLSSEDYLQSGIRNEHQPGHRFTLKDDLLQPVLERKRFWSANGLEEEETSDKFRAEQAFGDNDDPVLLSSRRMALMRAVEATRTPKLIDDEFSRWLAGDDFIKEVKSGNDFHEWYGRPIVIRTRYFDDKLEDWMQTASLKDNTEKVVLLLGSGMDTRSWRSEALSNAHVIEVDSFSNLEYKIRILDEQNGFHPLTKSWTPIAADIGSSMFWTQLSSVFSRPSWTKRATFMPGALTSYFVLLEGVSMYLDATAWTSLLRYLNELATTAGSRISLSFVDDAALSRAKYSKKKMLHKWKWSLNGSEEEVRHFFQKHLGPDWEIRELVDRRKAAERMEVYSCHTDIYDPKPSLHTFFLVLERTADADATLMDGDATRMDGLFGFPTS